MHNLLTIASLNDHSVFSIMARVEDDIQFSSSQLSADYNLLEAVQEVGTRY